MNLLKHICIVAVSLLHDLRALRSYNILYFGCFRYYFSRFFRQLQSNFNKNNSRKCKILSLLGVFGGFWQVSGRKKGNIPKKKRNFFLIMKEKTNLLKHIYIVVLSLIHSLQNYNILYYGDIKVFCCKFLGIKHITLLNTISYKNNKLSILRILDYFFLRNFQKFSNHETKFPRYESIFLKFSQHLSGSVFKIRSLNYSLFP